MIIKFIKSFFPPKQAFLIIKYNVKHTHADFIGKNIMLDKGLIEEFASINSFENGNTAFASIYTIV